MTPAPAGGVVLRMEEISKSFGATRALDGVRLDLRRGEVHALLGENGAGKSTLVKILSGAIRPDGGRMAIEDVSYAPAGPADGKRRGVSMIYQEPTLCPHLSVEENIMLGKEPRRRGVVRSAEMRRRVREVLDFMRHPEIDAEVPVRRLSVGARQIVEIARALVDEARILVMDEPTSSLSLEDGEELFRIIRRLKERGVAVIYISHFLEEVRRVADVFTVLRDGRNAGAGRIEETSLEAIIRMMVGREFRELFPRVPHAPGEPILSLDRFKGRRMAAEVDLTLRRGEILGIAGLIGSGRTEMLRAVFGLDEVEGGGVTIRQARFNAGKPWERIGQGLGFLSEDRQGEGLALSRSIADNATLSRLRPFNRFGVLSLSRRREAVAGLMEKVKVKGRRPDEPVAVLSGGNQQKIALARLLYQEAEVLLLDEPTRGIDVLSKAQIYEWIGRLAAAGKAVLFVSSYLPELLGVCDTIAVFHRGRVVESRPASAWDQEAILQAAAVGRTGAEHLEANP
ncbi:MAG: sugar ABC transporter ATP-binding protein [Candidatus Aminicenantales bacterium]